MKYISEEKIGRIISEISQQIEQKEQATPQGYKPYVHIVTPADLQNVANTVKADNKELEHLIDVAFSIVRGCIAYESELPTLKIGNIGEIIFQIAHFKKLCNEPFKINQ